ncbi:hypothetical protein BDA99DRAFT_539081 [Phascolomyces articulosus]|uniref:Galactose oxidase n=1 Tax=Phascolomyces articulosus TaxID=60185 RepID=A0AAD5JWX3_9FUNG|nr:hypothetical protein BDA99DRAFT_539081 [Phascolomyces articulosus]
MFGSICVRLADTITVVNLEHRVYSLGNRFVFISDLYDSLHSKRLSLNTPTPLVNPVYARHFHIFNNDVQQGIGERGAPESNESAVFIDFDIGSSNKNDKCTTRCYKIWIQLSRNHNKRQIIANLLDHIRCSDIPSLIVFKKKIESLILHPSYGYYPVDEQVDREIPYTKYGAAFTINETLYMYGGMGYFDDATLPTNAFSAISFDKYGAMQHKYVNDQGPAISNFQAVVLSNNDSVAIFGGNRGSNGSNNSSNTSSIAPPFLRAELYSFSQNTWSILLGLENITNASTAIIPPNRQQHTAVMGSDGLIYIQGGGALVNSTNMQVHVDSWSYAPESGKFFNLTSPPYGFYASTATALSDGRIIYLGGLRRSAQAAASPFLLDRCMIYFTSNDSWVEKELNSQAIDRYKKSRGYSNAALGPEGRYIYYYGGDSMESNIKLRYYHDLWILDTQTWTWLVPGTILGQQPSIRSGISSARINNNYILYCSGANTLISFNAVEVLKLPDIKKGAEGNEELDLESLKWIANVTTVQIAGSMIQPESTSLSRDAIIAISASFGVAGIVCFLLLLYKFSYNFQTFVWSCRKKIWNPRKGEPFWAEMTRFISRIVLFFLFVAFFVFIVIQVIQSPISMYTTTSPATIDGIAAPDIRFCFNGFTFQSDEDGNTYPQIKCMTNKGRQCDDNIVMLNLSYHKPYIPGTLLDTQCFLFRGNIEGDEEGPIRLSHLLPEVNTPESVVFSPILYNMSEQGRLYVSLYHAERDPNRVVYLDESTPLLTDDDLSGWKGDDRSATKGYVYKQMEYIAIDYQQKVTEKLQDTAWNYVGFASFYNRIPDIEANYHTYGIDDTPMEGEYGTIGNIQLGLTDSLTIISREQRVYSLVNGLAFIGGLYGLITAFQTAVFGYRPQSPFGILHRWSIGSMRHSIHRGLKNGFNGYKDTPIPLVNPVHDRHTSLLYNNEKKTDDNDSRILDKQRDIQNNNNQPFEHGQSVIRNKFNNGSETTTEALLATDDKGDLERNIESQQHQRHFGNENESQRLEFMEDRVQLLEHLFKSYYVDDEVFRKLDTAIKHPTNISRKREKKSSAKSGGILHQQQQQSQHRISNFFRQRRSKAGGYQTTRSSEHNSLASNIELDEDSSTMQQRQQQYSENEPRSSSSIIFTPTTLTEENQNSPRK